MSTQGLIAYYPFNGNANDESCNNYHGEINGATLTADRFYQENKALQFDGGSLINIADDPDFTFGTNSLSLSLWISIDKIGSYLMKRHDEFPYHW